MKKVLFLTNYAAPYRMDFFSEWGKQVELTVLFTDDIGDQKHRDCRWFRETSGNFTSVMVGRQLKFGRFGALCLDVTKYLSGKWDAIILGGYASLTAAYAIEYMRLRGIPWLLEMDGGFIKQDSLIRYWLKHHLISGASGWLSSGKTTTNYLCHYGAERGRVYQYPFTSLWQKDLDNAAKISEYDRKTLRMKLGMLEEHIIITVGRFSYQNGYGKGFDTVMKAAEILEENIGIYFIGSDPTEEFILWKEEKGLENVHFVGFRSKDELAEYYASADIFVLMTRGDVWGLVINEAMIFGLPVITTDRCVAGIDLVADGDKGSILKVGDYLGLANKIKYFINRGGGKKTYVCSVAVGRKYKTIQ